MKLAIVGNAKPSRNLSSEIDSCSLVVRFNNTNYLGSGLVGERCDIHVIQHEEMTALAGGVSSSKASEFWIICDSPVNCNAMEIMRKNNLSPRVCVVLFRDGTGLAKELSAKYPSSGAMAINSLLGKAAFLDWDKLLFCFTWEGDPVNHNWNNERELCERYEREGRLRIVR